MNVTAMRAWIRDYARLAGDATVYPDDRIDRAAQTVCNRFARVTRCLIKASSIAIIAATAAVDVSAVGPLFRPERVMNAYLLGVTDGSDGRIEVVDWLEFLRCGGQPSTGRPTKLAWEDATTAAVWPTPDVNYTARLRWWQPFTTWTPGAAGDGITLNLPDDYLAEILPVGPTALLQHNEPEAKYASASWKRYLEYEATMIGAGDLGARVSRRAIQE